MMRKNVCIAITAIGAVLFGYGSYMASHAAYQEGKINQAESTGRRPTLGPVRRNVGLHQEINKQKNLGYAGREMAAAQTRANWLRGIGVVLFIIGVAALLYYKKPFKR